VSSRELNRPMMIPIYENWSHFWHQLRQWDHLDQCTPWRVNPVQGPWLPNGLFSSEIVICLTMLALPGRRNIEVWHSLFQSHPDSSIIQGGRANTLFILSFY
jgi:hypothetical protein